MPTSYAPEEWAIAKRPNGGWVLLGAPSADAGQVYRVVWPLSPDMQGLVNDYHERVWEQPEFAPVIEGLNRIISVLASTGEYVSEPAFDLAAWVAEFEGVQAS